MLVVATLGLVAAACGDSGDTATGDVDSVATSTSASVVGTTSVAPSSPTTADVETTTTEAAPTSLIVMADDGEAVLEIPPGALPSDVDPDSIRISRIDSVPAGVDEDLKAAGFSPVRTYELLPDGVVFLEPAVLRVPVETGSGALTTAFLIGNDEIEALDFREASSPSEDGTIGILVPHFSVLTLRAGAYLSRLIWPDRPIVGQPFTVTTQVYRKPGAISFEQFRLRGFLLMWEPPQFEPSSAQAPPETLVVAPSFTSNLTFTCTKPGKATMIYGVTITVDPGWFAEWLDNLAGIDRRKRVQSFRQVKVLLECVAPEAPTSVAGIYDGSLQIGAVQGAPGGPYTDRFQLILDDCETATLTQRGSQMSSGRFTRTGESEVRVSVRGTGDGYTEGYELTLETTPDGLAVFHGLTAGGGHGFGSIPEPSLLNWILYIGHDDEMVAGAEATLSDFGWFNTTGGSLTRSGDAPECSE